MIKKIFEKANYLFVNFKQKQKQRVVFVSFLEDGLLLEKAIFFSKDSNVQCWRKKIFIKNLSEKNFKKSFFLKIFFFFLFFPFSYKVVINLCHLYCYSQCSLLKAKRKNFSQNLTLEEINSFFLQNIWKLIEEQKRKIVKRKELEETEILLVNNITCGMKIDGKIIPQDFKDISHFQGKDLKINLLQTFVRRSFFIDIAKILPRRAHLTSFFEEGITLATSIYLKEFFHFSKKEVQPFILFFLKEKETSVFVFDREKIYSFDYLNFGYFSFYQVFNDLLGIDKEVFKEVIKKIEKNELSLRVRDYFLKIIGKELKSFYYFVFSLKKSLRIRKHYFYGGRLAIFLKKWKKKSSIILEKENVFFPFKDFKEGSCFSEDEDLFFQSLLAFSLENIFRKNLANNLVVKLVRWLIPHNIQIE